MSASARRGSRRRSGYRQLPRIIFRKIHLLKFKTPWLALVFLRRCRSRSCSPSTGKTAFLGAVYSFGATFSFTVAHASVVRLRMKLRDGDEVAFKARPNVRWRGVSWPIFAIVGGLGTGLSWVVIVITTPTVRYAGLAWLVMGFAFYVFYTGRS